MKVERPSNPEERAKSAAERRIRRAAEGAVAHAVKAGPAAYDRARDLPKLIRLYLGRERTCGGEPCAGRGAAGGGAAGRAQQGALRPLDLRPQPPHRTAPGLGRGKRRR